MAGTYAGTSMGHAMPVDPGVDTGIDTTRVNTGIVLAGKFYRKCKDALSAGIRTTGSEHTDVPSHVSPPDTKEHHMGKTLPACLPFFFPPVRGFLSRPVTCRAAARHTV